MRAHDVRAPSPATLAGALSGGNQQKFILGRELDARPALVVAENPVRGLDHLATAQVLRELQHAADAGSAVVLYSGDLDELLPVGDRMFVMFAGRLREVPVTRSAVAGATGRRILMRRADERWAVTAATLLVIVAAVAAILIAGGYDTSRALAALWNGAFGSPYAVLSATLVRATPLLFVGLAVGLAFRAGVLNIGAEGQLLVGATSAVAVGLLLGGLPRPPALPVVLIAGAAAGSAWAGVAAWLRQRFGVLEVISTLMLNFVASYTVSWAVRGPLQEPTHVYPQTVELADAVRLPALIAGHRLHLGFVSGLALAAALWWFLMQTAAGFRVRAVGAGERAARGARAASTRREPPARGVHRQRCARRTGGASEVTGVTFSLYEGISPGTATAPSPWRCLPACTHWPSSAPRCCSVRSSRGRRHAARRQRALGARHRHRGARRAGRAGARPCPCGKEVLMADAFGDFLQASVRTATPLALAAYGELVVERAGIINLGLEARSLPGHSARWWVPAPVVWARDSPWRCWPAVRRPRWWRWSCFGFAPTPSLPARR